MTSVPHEQPIMIKDPRRRLSLLIGAAILVAIAFLLIPPMDLGPSYHNFADRRTILGIPNFWDVASNLPFAVVGLWGAAFTMSQRGAQAFERPSERWAYLIFFASLVLTWLGSSYYHVHPANNTLIWDRLPMSIAFMAIFAAVIAERIDSKIGTRLLLPLIALGVGSVLQWYWTQMHGAGDVRLYAVVQFFPTLAIPLMVLFFPSRYSHGNYLLMLFAFYVEAKAFEYFDHIIFSAGNLLSGHTLKHLAAAAGTFWVLQMLRRRSTGPSKGEVVEVPLTVSTQKGPAAKQEV